jgi:hypothetical protein
MGKAKDVVREVAEKASLAPMDENQAVIYLKNGSALSCVIVAEDAQKVVANWEGGEVTFGRGEIARIERHRRISENRGIFIPDDSTKIPEWPFRSNPVIRLTNRQAVDGRAKAVKGDIVLVDEDLGGGASITHEIPRGRIEAFEYKPVRNDAAGRVEERLRTLFPKMRVHRDGLIVLFTDTQGSSLKALKQTLQDQVKTLAVEYPELLAGREPAAPLFVVVFDDLLDYTQYAISDGVPPWMCPGYFSPTEKVLFMMNYFGDQFTALLQELVLYVRKSVNRDAEALQRMAGQRYEDQIEGLAQDVKNKVENMAAYLRSIFLDQTLVTLRHEITHAFFNAYGLQTVVVSRMKDPDPKLVKKKRELLETQDIEKKKELIVQILGMRRGEEKDVEIEVSNSWFVEGLAEYASTSAVGSANAHRLHNLKEKRRQNALLPIEQLTVYRMGSFSGVADEAVLAAYAQSWSFVDFLMRRHRTGFIRYLDRMARERAEGQEDIRWLLEVVGKGLRELEEEWLAYVDSLPDVPDPQIEQWFRVREILGIGA